jgi:hypothetical protein
MMIVFEWPCTIDVFGDYSSSQRPGEAGSRKKHIITALLAPHNKNRNIIQFVGYPRVRVCNIDLGIQSYH